MEQEIKVTGDVTITIEAKEQAPAPAPAPKPKSILPIDLSGFNEEQIFTQAVRGLASQGFHPGVNDGGGCRYYEPTHGRRCIAGHLCTEEQAKAIKDRGTWNDVVYWGEATPTYQRLVQQLQAAHDGGIRQTANGMGLDLVATRRAIKKNLWELATRLGLHIGREVTQLLLNEEGEYGEAR